MSVAKNIEITSTSPSSFEDAIEKGIARAAQSLKNVSGAWIKDQKINIENGTATEYQVAMIITFVLNDADDDDDEEFNGDDEDETSDEAEVGGRGGNRGGGKTAGKTGRAKKGK